jgi:hypothetical protein
VVCDVATGNLDQCASGQVTSSQPCPSGETCQSGSAPFCSTADCAAFPQGTGSYCELSGAHLIQCVNGTETAVACGTSCRVQTCDTTTFPCANLPDGSDCVGGVLLTCKGGVEQSATACAGSCTSQGAGGDSCANGCAGLADGWDCDPKDRTYTRILPCAGGQLTGPAQTCSRFCEPFGGGKDRCESWVCNTLPNGTGYVCDEGPGNLDYCYEGSIVDGSECDGCVILPGGNGYCPGG